MAERLVFGADGQRQVPGVFTGFGHEIEGGLESAIIHQADRLEAFQRGDSVQQMASIGMQVHDAPVKLSEDPLEVFAAPTLEACDRCHVEGIDAFGDDASRNPLHHVAAGAACQ